MNDKPDDCGDDDRRIASETTADLQANRFDLEADDLEGDAIDDLLEVETEDIDELLAVDGDDLEAAAAQLQADRYAEEVARRWGTPEGEWWP